MEANHQRIVAFIDILGFKALIEQSAVDITVSQTVDRSLRNALEWVGGKNALSDRIREHWQVRVFSDCCAISLPASVFDIATMVEGLAAFQREIVASGLLLRGGITIGQHAELDITTFSPALLRAYQMESREAVYPRICLDAPILPILDAIDDEEYRFGVKELILRDTKGVYFLSYLNVVMDDDWSEEEHYLEQHSSLIVNGLTNARGKMQLLRKYIWLARYHNWCLTVAAYFQKTRPYHYHILEDEVWNWSALWVDQVGGLPRLDCLLWEDAAFSHLWIDELEIMKDFVADPFWVFECPYDGHPELGELMPDVDGEMDYSTLTEKIAEYVVSAGKSAIASRRLRLLESFRCLPWEALQKLRDGVDGQPQLLRADSFRRRVDAILSKHGWEGCGDSSELGQLGEEAPTTASTPTDGPAAGSI